ncbi:MAG TPA: TolC family protein [Verrucomicrobiae bacterium]|jgi:outer membrane protein TolC|nr:TolC family protein [Verrucomicrobiae bacterium]
MIPKITTLAISAALGALLLLHGTDAAAQRGMPPKKDWVVSSDELIRIALTNNISILISQLQPQIDQFSLEGLYGAYEPSLTFNATHSFDSFPSGVFTQAGLAYPATTEQINSYTPGLTGLAPWGLSYTFTGPLSEQNISGAPDLYSSQPGLTVDQPIMKNFVIDNTRYQISLSKSTLKVDELALRLQIMTVVNNIKAAYYTLISDRELVGVQEMAVKLAEETAHEDEQKVQAGAEALLVSKQSQSQAASARSDLLTAQATLAAQENVVRGLLGLRRENWTSLRPVPAERLLAVPEDFDVRECWWTAMEKRPDMLQAKLKAETQHLLIKLDFNQLLPEVDLVGGYGHNATEMTFNGTLSTIGRGTFPFYDYGVVLTIPLGNTTARSKYKADKAALQQLLLQIKQVELTIIPAIDNDVTKIKTDLLRVDSTRLARMYAEEALQGEQIQLQQGKVTSFFVLQDQQTLTARRSDEIQALANYNIDLDQLAFDEGTILERNHIDLRVR